MEDMTEMMSRLSTITMEIGGDTVKAPVFTIGNQLE